MLYSDTVTQCQLAEHKIQCDNSNDRNNDINNNKT